MRKASDDQILSLYAVHQSVWKVAEILNMCGQSVHERLVKINSCNKIPVFTEKEKNKITNLYTDGFLRGDGKLERLCSEIGRDKTSVCLQAKKMGLTSLKRKTSDSTRKEMSSRFKIWHEKNPHPKGMLGKTHSPEYCLKISKRMKSIPKKEVLRRVKKSMKTKLEKYGSVAPANGNAKVTWKQAWRTIGGKEIYFRSAWEANYGRFLQWKKENGLIKDWLHEPKTFWFEKIKRGSVTYLPDFKIIENDDTHNWVEVKGWMDARSKTKIRRFKKYFPKETLTIIGLKWFKTIARKYSKIIPEWEKTRI